MPFSTLYGLYQDPGKAASQYTNQVPGETQKFNQPYIDRGQSYMDAMDPSVRQGISDPGQFQNDINQNYTQSKGYQFSLDEQLGAAENAAAAGGMAGSPMHQQQNMQLANNIAQQDFNTWADRNANLYGMNMNSANQGIDRAQNASNRQSDAVSTSLNQNAGYSSDNAQRHNMMVNAFAKNIGSLLGITGKDANGNIDGQLSQDGFAKLIMMMMGGG